MELNIRTIRKYLGDPLFRTSFFIMIASISTSAFGFIFWMIAAKLFSNEEVGIASALISSMMLLVLLSRLGFDYSIIRFFTERNKNSVVSTAIVITTFSTVLLGIIFIAGIDIWSPQLNIVKGWAIPFLVFLVANSIISIAGSSLIAFRKSSSYFFLNLLQGLKIPFLFPLVFLGALGIFSSYGMACVISVIFSTFLLFRYVKPTKIDRIFLRNSLNFSIVNYVAVILATVPTLVMPIMVLNVLGAESAAHYYIVYAIASLLFIIPAAFSTSLFVEGSYGNSLKVNALKSLRGTLYFLIPAVLTLFFIGNFILGFIGDSYAENFDLLRLMLISSIFCAVCQIYLSITRIQNNLGALIFVSALIFLSLICSSYLFMIEFGINGIGYAWVLSYGVGTLISVLFWKKQRILVS